MINTTIGKYRITRKIGEGGMATVYEAVHTKLDKKVAIKVLNPSYSSNPQVQKRFEREARLMASLEHENITRITDFEEQPGQLCIVMELLGGEDLSSKIRREGPLKDSDAMRIFSQVLKALSYAHQHPDIVAHRDIKPSNIFILPDGKVKILDFGIAKIVGEGLDGTRTGLMLGTPLYMSPEQVRTEKNIDHRTDIYSIGVTMYFALTGTPPYDDNTDSLVEIWDKIRFKDFAPINSKFWPMIKKACKKDRNERYQDCNAWLKELQRLNNDSTVAEETIIYGGNSTDKGQDETVEWDAKEYLNDARTLSRLEAKLDELWKKQKYSISPDELIQAGFKGGFNKEFEVFCGKYRLHRLNHLSAFDLSRANNFEETTEKNGITKFLFITAVGLISLVLFGLLINTCNESNSAEARAKYLSDSIILAVHQRNTDSITAAQSADSAKQANEAAAVKVAGRAQVIADSTAKANAVLTITPQPTNNDNTVNVVAGEVRIGTQVWMTRNLDVDRFRNGDPIPEAKTAEEWLNARVNKQPAWCYYNNDPANGAKYGKLYNWYAVNDPRGLAPAGWHIPTDTEWFELIEYLGGESKAGKKLKSSSGWTDKGNGTNESGFAALPGGLCDPSGTFDNLGESSYWWSSSKFSNAIVKYFFIGYRGDVYRSTNSENWWYYVRCLRD